MELITSLNPSYRKRADRLSDLIKEGQQVASRTSTSPQLGVYNADNVALEAWLTKVHNIVETTFGIQSPHNRKLTELTRRRVNHPSRVQHIVGLLVGALDDLENGYLIG